MQLLEITVSFVKRFFLKLPDNVALTVIIIRFMIKHLPFGFRPPVPVSDKMSH